MILRTGFGVAFRFTEPAVLRMGCKTRLTGLGKNPLRKLIAPASCSPPSVNLALQLQHQHLTATVQTTVAPETLNSMVALPLRSVKPLSYLVTAL